MSKKTLVETIESSEPLKGPSTGCTIDLPPCSLCGKTDSHTHRCDVVKYDPDDYTNVKVIAYSLVSAPKCDLCQQPMDYLKTGTDWTCRDALCKKFNISVSTGIGGVIS